MHQTIRQRIRPLREARPRRGGRAPPLSDYDLNERPPVTGPLRDAAVLVPLVDRGGDLSVLLTRRTDHLHDHAGQISFPGGRLEDHDAGPIDAALRETREEIGLDGSFIEVIGCLDDYETITGYLVTPVVSFVRTGFTLELDSFEVADAFEVPLDFFMDSANHERGSYLRDGVRRHYHVFHYGERQIWGATAAMLMNLYRRLTGDAAAS